MAEASGSIAAAVSRVRSRAAVPRRGPRRPSVSVHPGTSPSPVWQASLYPHGSDCLDGHERVVTDLESA
jgi:hypothetical protein